MTELNIIRIECELADPYRSLTNKLNGEKPKLPRGRDIQVELGVRERGDWLVSIEPELVSVTVEVKPTPTTAATVTVTMAAPFTTCQEGEWEDNSSSHVQVPLPNGQTSGFTVDANSFEDEYWLVVTAYTQSGRAITLAAGWVTVVEDGGNYSATTPAASDSTFLTAAQTLAIIDSLQKRAGVFEENGYKGKWGFDTDGKEILHRLP